MPTADALTEEQFETAGYGQFNGTPTRRELERFFFLDDADRRLVAKRRGDHNRLGFALQVVTARYVGTFLADPLDVPTKVVDYVAKQLDIADASCVKAYLEREKTRFEHQWEIVRDYGWQDFAEVAEELTRWVDDRAWITGDGPRTLFDAAVGWLRERQVLLPGVSTLVRLVGQVREEAQQRFWDTLAGLPTPSQARQLEGLLDVPRESRISDLDRLRKGPVTTSGKSMVTALDRVAEVTGLGLGSFNLGAVPRRRLMELARYGMAGKAPLLRRHPPARKLATLVATVVHLQTKATDDALELFDVLMKNDLLAQAYRQSKEEKVRRYPQVSRDAGKLAAAVRALLKASELGYPMSLEAVWEAIEAVVSRGDLQAAVDNITLVPGPDEDPDAEWRGSLVQRYGVVRQFLPQLCATIELGATAEAAPVLEALLALPELMEAGPSSRVPAGHLDADRVVAGVVPPAWRRVVFPPGRPEGTVHRAGYVFCVLEQFHQRLQRRDIFAPASSRWADPRGQLLTGDAWEATKGPVLNALQLPEKPERLLEEHARDLDAALRDVASRLDADLQASVDAEGRLHASALAAIPDPPSLIDLRKRTEAMMPRVDIGELILEVMSWQPRFLQAFTALSGGERRLDNLNVSIAAALTAQALNIGYGPVITPGVEALTRDRISHVDQSYLRADTVAPANAPLIEAQADIALARDHWGGGLVAAVDGIRFVVPVRSIDARPNPKYFGRRRGATWLNLINDVGAGLAGMVVSGTARDSLHIIDLIHRQEAGQRPEVIISDAGAYSDVVFGLLHLLNFDYRPQPADLPDTKLWCIDGSADYGPLATATRGRIDLAKIPRPLARLSPHRGVDPHRCQRPRRDPDACPGRELHAAGRGPGPLRAGLQNAARPLLRRRGAVPTQIKGMRNLQEGRHDLGRHLFHGRKGELRQAYQEGMEDQLGALGLALNCVVLWNSVYLDAAVARLRADGYPVREEDLARLSPYIRKHINVQGHTSSNYRTFAPTESQRFGRARGLTGIRGGTLAL